MSSISYSSFSPFSHFFSSTNTYGVFKLKFEPFLDAGLESFSLSSSEDVRAANVKVEGFSQLHGFLTQSLEALYQKDGVYLLRVFGVPVSTDDDGLVPLKVTERPTRTKQNVYFGSAPSKLSVKDGKIVSSSRIAFGYSKKVLVSQGPVLAPKVKTVSNVKVALVNNSKEFKEVHMHHARTKKTVRTVSSDLKIDYTSLSKISVSGLVEFLALKCSDKIQSAYYSKIVSKIPSTFLSNLDSLSADTLFPIYKRWNFSSTTMHHDSIVLGFFLLSLCKDPKKLFQTCLVAEVKSPLIVFAQFLLSVDRDFVISTYAS